MASPDRTATLSTPGDHQQTQVSEMFARIATRYDRVNSIMSLGLHGAWRRRAVALVNLQPGETMLDICSGTGDFLQAALRRTKGRVNLVAMDYCRPMLEIAREKIGGQPAYYVGDATRLPFAEGKFDVVTVGWGLRNVPDLEQTLAEVRRVLKPNGRFVSLDCFTPSNPLMRLSGAVLAKVLPFLGSIVGDRDAYTYLPKSIKGFVSKAELDERLKNAGFVDVRSHNLAGGNIALHKGVKK